MKENTQIPFILIEPSTKADYIAVNLLLQKVPEAVLPVVDEEFNGWVDAGNSLVAKTMDGVIIGHQAISEWEQSKWNEVRSAFVDDSYRGIGINSRMKATIIARTQTAKPESTICLFAEGASMSPGLAQKGGFVKKPLSEVPEEFFQACPADQKGCFGKVRSEPAECGCKAFILEPGKKFYVKQ